MINNLAQVNNCPADQSQDPGCLTNLPEVAASSEQLQVILQIAFGIIAVVTVIIIIIQGIKFALSGGDPQKAANARKAVIYAAVGLAVALSAEIIVTFMLGRI